MATGPNHGLQLTSGRLVVPFNTYLSNAEVGFSADVQGCSIAADCARRHPEQRSIHAKIIVRNKLDPTDEIIVLNQSGMMPNNFVLLGRRAGVLVSDDHGLTWQIGGFVDKIGASEAAVAQLLDGSVLMSYRVEFHEDGCRRMALSTDGGMHFKPSFKPEVTGSDCIPSPVCQGSMVRLPSGRVATSGPGTKKARSHLTVHISHSGSNLTFLKHAPLVNGASGYSDLVHIPSRGLIGVMYEDGHGNLRWQMQRGHSVTHQLTPVLKTRETRGVRARQKREVTWLREEGAQKAVWKALKEKQLDHGMGMLE